MSLKELPNNRFGTVSEIYWDDSYLNAQVGAHTRGTYTIRIVDPILFIRNWLPATYMQPGAIFDFTDPHNDVGRQLFNEVVGSLSQAFSLYANDPQQNNRMARIQQDTVGFARSLSEAVEQTYQWRSVRGLEIVNATIVGLEYDEPTRELLKVVQRADALLGARGNSNLQASVAAGIQNAGEIDGAGGILGLAVASNATGIMGLQQPTSSGSLNQDDDALTKLTKLKELLGADLITQADYDSAKDRILGL